MATKKKDPRALPTYPAMALPEGDVGRRREVLYWRMMAHVFEQDEKTQNFDGITKGVVKEVDLPNVVLDDKIGIDTLVQRYPELQGDFDHVMPRDELADVPDEDAEDEEEKEDDGYDESAQGFDVAGDPRTLRRALIFSKLLMNVFGPNASRSTVTAGEYNQWTQDVGALERAFGFAPGELRGQRAGRGSGAEGQGPGGQQAGRGSGGGFSVTEEDFMEGLRAMEKDIIKRMALREVLQDSKLANKITPSMPLVEQLLRDKSNLSGVALKNAKMLIQKYIDEVAEVLKLQVEQAKVGQLDMSVPPKRVFRNLDLKRTIWKNLVNYDPEEGRLYVDQLYFRRTSTKSMSNRLIIVVDQSGSMVDSMVNCTILASIFAGLPKVEAHLIAYDTQYVDLSDYVHDPFEVLLRTNLGGGTEGMVCMEHVRGKILQPKNTALVWISDFYDWDNERLYSSLKAIKESGVHLIPVGSVTSSGYLSINTWFKQRFKELGTPLISGSIKTLIKEIKQFVAI